jgi:hypothetical protein
MSSTDGDADVNGVQGVQGVQGIQGVQGVEGPSGGAPGTRGVRGVEGPRGLPGRTAVTRLQFIVSVVLMVSFFLLLAWRSEVNAAGINANTDRVVEQRYQSCLNGVRIIEKFNSQMQELADIEKRNTRDPLARERIKAYESGITPLPDVPCRR